MTVGTTPSPRGKHVSNMLAAEQDKEHHLVWVGQHDLSGPTDLDLDYHLPGIRPARALQLFGSAKTLCRCPKHRCMHDITLGAMRSTRKALINRPQGGVEPLTLSGPTDLKSAPRTVWDHAGNGGAGHTTQVGCPARLCTGCAAMQPPYAYNKQDMHHTWQPYPSEVPDNAHLKMLASPPASTPPSALNKTLH